MNKKPKHFWLRQLRDLERYCNEKGFFVICKPVDIETMEYDKKLITLSTKTNDEVALYVLLHEMGHAILIEKGKTYEKSYGYVFENYCKASMAYNVTILEEELDAWKEGAILAKSLNLYIDRRKWERVKTRCISSYISWIEAKKQKRNNKSKKTKKQRD